MVGQLRVMELANHSAQVFKTRRCSRLNTDARRGARNLMIGKFRRRVTLQVFNDRLSCRLGDSESSSGPLVTY
jgi:hypothetical protein